MEFKGSVFKYGDDIDTDVIIPARYLTSIEPDWLAAHCLEDLDPDFSHEHKPGDIIVGGKNFGCGSSREQAPLAIKYAGISCVIAKTFARIFYRNAINIGLPIIICPEAVDEIEKGDQLTVDIEKGTILHHRLDKTYHFLPLSELARQILSAGGLFPFLKQQS